MPADVITYPGTTGAEPLGMPIGGIGTSTFEIGRDGAFKNNRLQNGWTTSLPQRPNGIDDGSFISVFISRGNGQGIGRIMQLESPGGLPGLPGLKYTGRFPFVDLDYDDPQLPAAVRLEVLRHAAPGGVAGTQPVLAVPVRRLHAAAGPARHDRGKSLPAAAADLVAGG